ncbi:MAG: YDG domain-containing protein, partial [Mycobacterium sp.]|nr:YDG domain-containing protein [Mycobacterium sp.]
SGVTASDKTYDQTATATLTGTAALTGVVGTDDVQLDPGATVTASFADKTVGIDRTVTVSGYALIGADAGNYTLTQPTLLATINPAGLTVVGAAVATKPYDQTTAAAIAGAALSGVLEGDDVSLANADSGTFDTKDVGTGKTVTTAMTLSGADAGNYLLTQPALTGEIDAIGLTVAGAAVTPKVYDGTTDAAITGASLAGVISGDDVELANAGSGTFADPNANTGIAVSTAMTISGTDAIDYTLTQPTLAGDITVRGVTVTVTSGQTKVYGVSDPVFAYTADPLVGSDSYSGALTRVAGETVGSYAILQGSVSAGGNYQITFNGDNFVITPAPVTITGVTAADKTYDGGTTVVLSGGSPTGVLDADAGNVTIVAGSGVFASASVGSQAVTASGYSLTGPAVGNYVLTGQPAVANATIAAAPVTVVSGLTGDNKAYDSTDVATISSNSVVLGGVLDADAANVVLNTNGYAATFAQTNAANNITVSVSGLTLTGSAAGNYSLAQPVLSANITPYGLTISGVTASDKTYDQTATATLTGTAALTGVVGTDDVQLDPGATVTASFA